MSNNHRPTNASISTMWALNNFQTLDDFFKTSKQLGFQKIELNHQVSLTMLSQANLDHCQFSSVHEPCPSDVPTKELVERDWLISAVDEDKRAHGVAAVRKSIDLAHQLSAPVVVVHCGAIPFNGNYEGTLRGMFKTGETQSHEYLKIKQRLEDTRKSLVGPRLHSVKLSLQELIEYAAQLNIKLGLENRYHFMDIPSIDEMAGLLSLADPNNLGFVYDVGHAQALDRLGFYSHVEWLTRFSSRMIGCHLHDVIGLTDHYAPGRGEIDFKFISDFLPENAFRTFEMLPGNTLAQVRDGLQLLIKSGCIRII
jgi:sugar phosphate isomerase/epimerase